VVSVLTEELVRRGHEVTLFASGDSRTHASLVACCPRGLRLDPEARDTVAYTMVSSGTPEEYGSKKTWGHSTYDYVVQIAAATGVRRVALTHHDPSHNDHFVADIERKARTLALERGTGLDVFCAYEGCELVLEPRSTLKPFVTADPSSRPSRSAAFTSWWLMTSRTRSRWSFARWRRSSTRSARQQAARRRSG
jgi:hypothetical protein